MVVTCQICEKKFSAKPSVVKRGWAKFCSNQCRWESYKVKPEVRKCARCDKEFFVGGATGKERKPRNARYCNRACGNRQLVFARNMSEVERAWFAGVFDGEGSIVLYKPHCNGKSYWRIQIANTVENFIKYIADITGIYNISSRPKPENPKHNQCFNWQAHGENAKNILKQILPLLIVKRKKALLMLKSV